MTITTTEDRSSYQTVTPYLMVRAVDPVIAFVEEAFDGAETFRTTGAAGGTHAEVRIGDSMIMLGGDTPGGTEPTPAALFVYVEDVDGTYDRALRAGARSLMEPAERFGASRGAGVVDPFGNQWFLGSRD